MGDDVGWFNVGAFHRGMMFTDCYAEASCTAVRANFITGELPIRTGLTTVGQTGADIGMPDAAVTVATILKAQGYQTGQFGKNHPGGLNKLLPTVHGFDKFSGYLSHLDATSDPYWFDYPQDWIDKTGTRDLIYSSAPDIDDATMMPRWGRIGKQRITDEGPLAPFPNISGRQNWQELRKAWRRSTTSSSRPETAAWIKRSRTTSPSLSGTTPHACTFTYIPPQYQAMMNAKSGYGLEEAGMAQINDSIGALLKHIDDRGETDNTIVIFATDNGSENVCA
jgi:arylsulfatase A-like enzyme